jgi:membrane associated rhomboid family serine protease
MAGFLDEFRDAFAKRNNGLIQLIWINVMVFMLLILFRVVLFFSESSGIYALIVSNISLPAALPSLAFKPWTFLTYAFAHEDPFHILFNMLTLYWFGGLIQEYIGHKRVISIYILGALAGGLLYVGMYNLLPVFKGTVAVSTMLGASGAVLAIVVAAATLLPNYTFFLLFFGPIRIKYIAAFMVILSFVSTVGRNAGGNFAHLGGALFGYVFIVFLKKGTDLGAIVGVIGDFLSNIFKPSPKPSQNRPSMKVTYRSEKNQGSIFNSSSTTNEFPDDAEVDTILDKISKSGYESLSKEEKQKLFQASQKN